MAKVNGIMVEGRSQKYQLLHGMTDVHKRRNWLAEVKVERERLLEEKS